MREHLTFRYVVEWLYGLRITPKKKWRREELGQDLQRLAGWLESERTRVEGLEVANAHVKKLEASQQLYEQLIVHARTLFPWAFQQMEQRYGSLFASYRALILLLDQRSSYKAPSPDNNDVTDASSPSEYLRTFQVERLQDQETRYKEVLAHAESLFPEVFRIMQKRHEQLEAPKKALFVLLNKLSFLENQPARGESSSEEMKRYTHDNPAFCRSVLTPRQDEA